MAVSGLCQDCLRVRTFPSAAERDAAVCECGAGPENFCGCDTCRATVAALEQGCREAATLGLQPGVRVLRWSRERGTF